MVDFHSHSKVLLFLFCHFLFHVMTIKTFAFRSAFLARTVALAKFLEAVAFQTLTLGYLSVTAI